MNRSRELKSALRSGPAVDQGSVKQAALEWLNHEGFNVLRVSLDAEGREVGWLVCHASEPSSQLWLGQLDMLKLGLGMVQSLGLGGR